MIFLNDEKTLCLLQSEFDLEALVSYYYKKKYRIDTTFNEIQKPEKYPIKCQFYFENKWVEEMLISEYHLILIPEYFE